MTPTVVQTPQLHLPVWQEYHLVTQDRGNHVSELSGLVGPDLTETTHALLLLSNNLLHLFQIQLESIDRADRNDFNASHVFSTQLLQQSRVLGLQRC